jgi:hypothetical protein
MKEKESILSFIKQEVQRFSYGKQSLRSAVSTVDPFFAKCANLMGCSHFSPDDLQKVQ